MRKKLIGIFVCTMLSITAALAAITAMSFEHTDLTEKGYSYSFTFIEPSFQTVKVDNSCYTKINMPGCVTIGKQAGIPMTSVKFIKLLLPPMREVSHIDVIGTPVELELGSTDLKESPIFPYQKPVTFGSEPEEFIIDTDLYSSDISYPPKIHGDYHIGYCRGYTILDMALKPIQYNPVKGKLFLYPEITINIEFEETEEVNQFFRNNQNDKEWVETLVYNPEETESYTQNIPTFGYKGGLCDPEDNYDYVIITTEYNSLDYWETSEETPYNWESLLEKHEEDDGLSCTLVTIEDIDNCEDYHDYNPLFDDLEAHIREFCKDAYQDWGTDYIFVGGDAEWIPARLMSSWGESNVDSDLYWSNLDNTFNDDEDNQWGEEGDSGFDLYAEIFIGRITSDEPQDVSNWMTKSFYYADAKDFDYLENGGFYGGDTGWLCEGDDFMDFSAIKGTDDWLGPDPHNDGPWPSWLGLLYGFETWNETNPDIPGVRYNLSVKWTAEPPNPGWKGGNESAAIDGLKNAINNDQVTIISGIAHADSQMSLDVGMGGWEVDYHNTKPFFIHDYGCHCGDMDDVDDGVLHSMLFHSDTELAFGCVYNTGYGVGNEYCTNSSSALQAKLFWDYFLDVANNSKDTTNWQLGKAHAWSKDVMAPMINWGTLGRWRLCIQCCLLFADPAQRLKSPGSPPETPEKPSGPTEGITSIEYTFFSSTTEPEGEKLFYMFDWGDGRYSEWLGPYDSGVTCEASYAWSYPGDFKIRVKAKDINGAESAWSDPSSIHILQAPILDIGVITGGLFKVSASIENAGAVDAIDVHWNIKLKGGVFIGKETSGIISSIIPDAEETISSNLILGLGPTTITVIAESSEGVTDTREQTGFVFLFFIKVNPGG